MRAVGHQVWVEVVCGSSGCGTGPVQAPAALQCCAGPLVPLTWRPAEEVSTQRVEGGGGGSPDRACDPAQAAVGYSASPGRPATPLVALSAARGVPHRFIEGRAHGVRLHRCTGSELHADRQSTAPGTRVVTAAGRDRDLAWACASLRSRGPASRETELP